MDTMHETKKWFDYAGDDSMSSSPHVCASRAIWPVSRLPGKCAHLTARRFCAPCWKRLRAAALPLPAGFPCRLLEELSKTELVSLAERGLVTPDFIARREGRALLCTEDESLSVSVNGGDHLLLAAMRPGLDLDGAYSAVDTLESVLSRALDFAFDEEFGYLTEDPADLGTGMHAELTLHLPALARAGSLPRVAAGLSKLGLRLREGLGAEPQAELYRSPTR